MAAALAIVAGAVAGQHAQTTQSGTQFRGGVEYVEVNARVEQDVRTFYVADIPLPSAAPCRADIPASSLMWRRTCVSPLAAEPI